MVTKLFDERQIEQRIHALAAELAEVLPPEPTVVGILKPTSEGKAAALLAADDPEQAMRAHENNYRSGGIEPMEDIPADLREQVAANNRLMSRVGVRGTPGIFYHDSAGEVQVKQGVPQGALREEILGPKPD